MDAQQRRYQRLCGKKVLWLSCYYTLQCYAEEFRNYLKDVAALGVLVYLVVGPESCTTAQTLARRALDEGLVTAILHCDIDDDRTAAKNIKDVVLRSKITFDAVYSHHEVAQTLVGEVAELLALPGNPQQAYVNARDKSLCRQICVQNGIQSPKFGLIGSLDQVEAVVAYTGLPVIIKPSSGAGSEFVFKCNNVQEVCMVLFWLVTFILV